MKKSIGKTNFILILIAICVGLIGIGQAISNVSYDSSYQFAMGMRLVNGDDMIIQMWEPHQTSAFLIAMLMWIFIKVTGTTTGIVVFVHLVTQIIRAIISYFLYRVIKEVSDKISAFIAAIVWFLILPKDVATPEFAMMAVLFSTLTALFLIYYFKSDKIIYLVLLGISLCLTAISYPSCALCYIGIVFLLILYSKKRIRDILITTGICALLGTIYVGYFLVKIGAKEFISIVRAMLSIEPTHTVSPINKALAYGKEFLIIAGIVGVIYLIAFAICKVCKLQKIVPVYITAICIIPFLIYEVFALDYRNAYSVLFMFIMVVGAFIFKKRERNENIVTLTLYISGMFVLFGALILSDQPIISSVPLAITAIVSVIPMISKVARESNTTKWASIFLALFFVFVFIRIVYMHIPIYGRDQFYKVTEDISISRSGPTLGIISDNDSICRQRDSYKEWEYLVPDGAKIWLIGNPVETFGYLYNTSTDICAPSVMSTPTYNESLGLYWEINPDKYPDVVIFPGYLGVLDRNDDVSDWIYDWLENEYHYSSYCEGVYWNYYYR